MDSQYILYSESLDYSDPHGYTGSFGRKQVNYQCHYKRSFLNECVKRIYILNGNNAPMMAAHYEEINFWRSINCLVTPPKMSVHEANVERVKRRLIFGSRKKPRKLQNPKRNDIIFSVCSYFKAKRHMWGVQKIRHNFLDRARQYVQEQLRQASQCKVEEIEVKHDNAQNWMHSTNNRAVSEVTQQTIRKTSQAEFKPNIKVCRRVNTLKEICTYEEEYNQRSLINENMVEAAIRSLLYLKALMQNISRQADGDDDDDEEV